MLWELNSSDIYVLCQSVWQENVEWSFPAQEMEALHYAQVLGYGLKNICNYFLILGEESLPNFTV